jgi:arylsulfatase A-like enzyme
MPLIFKVPGITEAGARCASPVSLMDLYPTLSELCGLPINSKNEGNSIIPLLKNVNTNWEKPALTTLGFDRHTVRNKKWRYIRYQDGAEELYNHDIDSHEWTNLANDPQYNSVKAEMAKHLPKVNTPEVNK